MLRIFGNCTLLAATLFAAGSFGLLASARTWAQEAPEEIPDIESQLIDESIVKPIEKPLGEPAEEYLEESVGEAACPVNGEVVAAGRGGRVRGCLGGRPDANCRPRTYGQPELFYNYYVPPTCGGVPAQMYLAPQPVPAWVGHTYYTYQPFLPHEMLYQHHRTYYRYYNGGRGLTRTSVSWTRPPFTGWSSTFRIAR